MALYKYDPLPLKTVEEKPWEGSNTGFYTDRIKYAFKSIKNPRYRGKEENMPNPNRVQFTIIGDRVTKEFTYCVNLVKGLYKYRWKNFDVPLIRGLNTIEWSEVLHDLILRFGGLAYRLQSSVAVLMDGNIVGGEKELKQLVETKLFYYMCLDYYNEGVAEFARFIRSTNRPFAYMHVSIDDKHIGTLIYMLYADIVPYTCENFLRLCKETKGGYGGTPVHRIVKDGWIQCGGFGLKSTPLSCENFVIPFDRRGVLAMANDGRDDDCSTQFFVLLHPAPWMNQKYVAFGQLVEGAATLEIENVTTWYESPTSKIIFYRCGILNMECQDIRFNKGATQYIDEHIEDLNSLAELLWEHLLEKTFLQAELRELERMRALEEQSADVSSQNGETTKMLEKSEQNNEFDVEEIYLKDDEDYDSYKHQSQTSINLVSLVVKPARPHYIPLTDVPYPGDVESDFDLKKFLKGDYCLESDLSHKKGELAAFPSELWQESESRSSTSEQPSIGLEEQEELDRYIHANVDRVSFAGEVIKNLAQVKNKAGNFIRESVIPDEKLRKIKLASTEYRRQKNKKKVSVVAPGAGRSLHIKRRQTGFIRLQDLVQLTRDFDEEEDIDDDDDLGSSGKATGISFSQQNSSASKPIVRRLTPFAKQDADADDDDDDVMIEEESPSKPTKESVLLRLYDEVNVDNENGPILKNYIPTAEMQHKNLLALTHYTPLFEAKESHDQYKRQSASKRDGTFEHLLFLRHGQGMDKRLSTDYVTTIEMEEYMPHSIRSVEYAKTRPTISVSDYQLQNLRYQEQLKRKPSLGSW